MPKRARDTLSAAPGSRTHAIDHPMPATPAPASRAAPLRQRLPGLGSTWLVLPLGLALSWAAFQAIAQSIEREAALRFDAAVREAAHSVELEMRGYMQVIQGMRALFSANPQLTRQQFLDYTASLDLGSRYPAFQSVNFARFVTAAERDAYTQRLREDVARRLPGLPPLRIRSTQGGPVPAGLPWHFVVEYQYPDVPDQQATLGFDLASDPARRPAAVHLAESGAVSSSGLPITVVSKRFNSNVLPMRAATYRAGVPLDTAADRWAAITGSVGTYFHVRLMFDRALKEAARPLRLRLYDAGPAAAPFDPQSAQAMLLYDNRQPDRYMAERSPMAHDAPMEQLKTVEWATRRWVLQFSSDGGFVSPTAAALPWLAAAGGVLATLLVFAWLQALARSRAHALAARRAQTQFLTNMSHELRTPLNAILGYAQLLGQAQEFAPRQAAAVATIHASGEHLLSLIDDMLDLARVEAGRLELHLSPVELHRLLDEVVAIISVRAREKRLAFTLDADPALPRRVHADGQRLRQVLLNLLGNAVKFTDEGEVRLRVRARAAPAPEPVLLAFEVEDSGVGIGEAQLGQLFQPFQQVGDPGRRRGGNGLGLAISRQLVRLMGGDIQVRSVPGRGSVFSFEIALRPIATPGEVDAGRRMPIGHAGGPKKVLVVDDAPENRAVMADTLGLMGFEVHEAADGAQCLERVRTLMPDLILMDGHLPVLSGLEAIQRLRAMPRFDRVPIIAISASASNTDNQAALAAGANAFLAKPFRAAALVAMLEEHLGIEFVYERSPAVAE